MNGNSRGFRGHVLLIGVLTLVITAVFAFLAEIIIHRLDNLYLSLIFLVLVITVGIVFDIVGTATTAARHAPLHALAAKRVFGASHAVYLVRNTPKVANITMDVIGDIAGIVAGALGISLIAQLIKMYPNFKIFMLNIAITSLIAALTVAGKAWGKKVAVQRSHDIVFAVGKLMAGWEKMFSWGRKQINHNKKRRVKQ
ncbi:MAG: hypothetical protein H0Z39_04620 [Peptococcaceae bacterium]|nr:hypothetical protein [Peptococcaceae bacterium]